MSPLDDIEKAMRMLRDRGAEMKAFEGLLTEISSALADILAHMEKPKDGGMGGIAQALSNLSIKAPDIHVNPTPVEIHVPKQAPPTVVVSPQDWTSLSIQIKPPSYDGTKNLVITKVK